MSPETIRLLSYGFGGLAILALLYFRVRRMSRSRPLKVERMWVRPAIMALICAGVLFYYPPRVGDLGWLAGALVIGGLVGWQRGRFVTIIVDPDTHAINQQASPAAIAFLVVVLGARMLLRREAMAAWHVSASIVADVSILFVLALFTVQQLEMAVRARRLLEEARARRSLSSSG